MTGISTMQVLVDEIIPSLGLARGKETSTGKSIEVRLLPMRTGRVPAVGERWLIDRTFGPWTFSALLTSPTLFSPPTHVGENPPADPRPGDRWVPTPAKVWDGTDWVDEP